MNLPDIGMSPELARLDDAARAVADHCKRAPDQRIQGLQDPTFQYQIEAMRYRLALTDRVAELERQLVGRYYKHLPVRWFSELNAEELLRVLPTLIEATLDWGHGNGYLMWFAYGCLDSLPRDQARDLYLEVFARSMRVYGMTGESLNERLIHSAETFVTSQQIYHSKTGHECQAALRDVIRVEMGEHFVTLYDQEWVSIRADDAADTMSDGPTKWTDQT
ncbi:hypothetical protein [Deinococcus radiotolerans]|uniref:hypothetical protein n=1 Tax=Deinococcus radiotolerans TaxID=1309407 RepID=UPI001668C785|nr:hypothetical protein [Deinococcus radiotolerans]